MNEELMVSIPQGEYKRLLEAAHWLDCFNAVSIDNTDAYSYAQEIKDEWENGND